MTQAISGVGTRVYAGDAATGSNYTVIPEVLSISGPELSAEQIEVTSLDSGAGYKEFIPGLLDGGAVTLEMNWTKAAAQTALRDRLNTRVRRQYRIQIADGTTAEFLAVVESWSLKVEPTSAVTASVTLRISGSVDWIAPAIVMLAGDSYTSRSGNPFYAQYLGSPRVENVSGLTTIYSTSGSSYNTAVAGTWLAGPTFGAAARAIAQIDVLGDVEILVIGGGTNDIASNPTFAEVSPIPQPPAASTLIAALVPVLEKCWTDGVEPIVINLPPVAGVWTTNTAQRAAETHAYNTWLATASTVLGFKLVNIYTPLSGTGTGAGDNILNPAYDIGDNLHVNIAGAQLIAGLVDAALNNAPVAVGAVQQVARARPNVELLSVNDLLNIQTIVSGLGSEWANADEIWLLSQADIGASGNAVTGLVNGTVASITGAVTHTANGMRMQNAQYLNTGIAASDISRTSGAGFLLGAWANPGTATQIASTYQASPIFSGYGFGTFVSPERVFFNGQQGAPPSNYVTTLSTLVDKCIEGRAVESGADQSCSIAVSGTQQWADTFTYTAPGSNPLLIGAGRATGTGTLVSTGDLSFRVFYLTNGQNNRAVWASVMESLV